MSSRHTPRYARLRITPCSPPGASVPSPTFRQSAPRAGDDSDARSPRTDDLSNMDLPITDNWPSPDNAAVMERGRMEVVRA